MTAGEPEGGHILKPEEGRPMEQVLQVRGLEVVDDSGQARITLGVFPEGVKIELLDATGKVRIRLAVLPEGSPGVEVFDAVERRRIRLDLVKNEMPRVQLLDASGRVLFAAP
jgi:hypothetical protein